MRKAIAGATVPIFTTYFTMMSGFFFWAFLESMNESFWTAGGNLLGWAGFAGIAYLSCTDPDRDKKDERWKKP